MFPQRFMNWYILLSRKTPFPKSTSWVHSVRLYSCISTSGKTFQLSSDIVRVPSSLPLKHLNSHLLLHSSLSYYWYVSHESLRGIRRVQSFIIYLNINYMVFRAYWIKKKMKDGIKQGMNFSFHDFLMISLSWCCLLHKSFWLGIHVWPAQTHINWANVFLQLVWLPYWFTGGRQWDRMNGPNTRRRRTFAWIKFKLLLPIRTNRKKVSASLILISSTHAFLSLLSYCLGKMWRRANPMSPLADGV